MGGLYSALKNRAAGGQYVPAEMVSKIDTAWAEGKISDARRAELTELTRACADPNYSPMTEGERALDERLFALEAAMLDVGMLLAELMGGDGLMAGFYVKMIELGRIALAQVPGYWQDAVCAAMGAGE